MARDRCFESRFTKLAIEATVPLSAMAGAIMVGVMLGEDDQGPTLGPDGELFLGLRGGVTERDQPFEGRVMREEGAICSEG